MAISRLTGQDKSGTSATTSVAATYASTPTQDNLMIATVYANVLNAVVDISGWSKAVGSDTASGASISIFYKVAGAGESNTVTATGTLAGSMHIVIFEYSGCATSSPLDATSSANSGAVSVNAQSTGTTATTSQADELLIGVVGFAGTGSAPSPSNSFNARLNTSRNMPADLVVSATGAYETTITVTGTAARMAGAIATFKALPPATPASGTLALLGVG